MKIVTAPGVTYVVYAAAGATVTCPDRPDPLLTCAGGKPNYFTAPGAEVEISDDSASIEACRDIKIEVSGEGGSGGGEWPDIRPKSNTWTGSNTFKGKVSFASADLHKTINSDTLTSTSVLNMGEADGRYALKGEGGGNDSGLTPEQVEKLTLYASAEGRNIPAAPQIFTEIGHTYTVSATASAVVVTDANGETRCTVPAGKQLSFVATTTTSNLSATDCTITENFRGAAHVVLSGGGSSEGGGEPEGDYISYDANGNIVAAKLDNLVNGTHIAYGGKRQNWDIPLPSLQIADNMFQNSPNMVSFTTALNKVTSAKAAFMGVKTLALFTPDLLVLVTGDSMFYNVFCLKVFQSACPKLQSAKNFLCSASGLEEVLTNSFPELIDAYWMCRQDVKLRVWNASLPKLKTADQMFFSAQLDKPSALTICNSVPTWEDGTAHPIMLGIHVDYKFDPDVNAALKRLDPNYEPLNLPIDEATGDYIEITEDKGWTLTVQWNGKATSNAYPAPAATYARRPQSVPVFAKLEYEPLPEGGTKPYLLWGHFVSGWEENGYMEFASLDEAREYFNLTE